MNIEQKLSSFFSFLYCFPAFLPLIYTYVHRKAESKLFTLSASKISMS